MSDLGHHLVLRLQDDRVIAPTLAQRRRVARVFAELARAFPILAWRVADTHIHVLVAGDADVAHELVRRLRIRFTLTLRSTVALEMQRCKPIVDQGHLAATFRYVLTQEAHHGVASDPEHEASSLPDTLGLRVICPEVAHRVHGHLPRVKRGELLSFLGVPTLEPEVQVRHLGEASRAVFALPELPAQGEGARARRAAVAAAPEIDAPALATLLGVTERAVRRIREAAPPEPRDVRAIQLQMSLRAVLETRAAP